MRAAALVLAALVTPAPSFAHCYSVWHYATPQHCGVRVAEDKPSSPPLPPEKELPPFTVNQFNTIILRPDPNRTDEEGRAQAIEILKQVMSK